MKQLVKTQERRTFFILFLVFVRLSENLVTFKRLLFVTHGSLLDDQHSFSQRALFGVQKCQYFWNPQLLNDSIWKQVQISSSLGPMLPARPRRNGLDAIFFLCIAQATKHISTQTWNILL